MDTRQNIYACGMEFTISSSSSSIYLSIYVIYSQDSIYYVEINYVQYICRTLATLLAIFHLLFNCFSYPEPKTTTTTSSFNNDHKHFNNNNNNNIEEKDPLSSGYRNYIHPYHQKHQTNNVIYFFLPFFLSCYCHFLFLYFAIFRLLTRIYIFPLFIITMITIIYYIYI